MPIIPRPPSESGEFFCRSLISLHPWNRQPFCKSRHLRCLHSPPQSPFPPQSIFFNSKGLSLYLILRVVFALSLVPNFAVAHSLILCMRDSPPIPPHGTVPPMIDGFRLPSTEVRASRHSCPRLNSPLTSRYIWLFLRQYLPACLDHRTLSGSFRFRINRPPLNLWQ